jgi:hypothetical protein
MNIHIGQNFNSDRNDSPASLKKYYFPTHTWVLRKCKQVMLFAQVWGCLNIPQENKIHNNNQITSWIVKNCGKMGTFSATVSWPNSDPTYSQEMPDKLNGAYIFPSDLHRGAGTSLLVCQGIISVHSVNARIGISDHWMSRHLTWVLMVQLYLWHYCKLWISRVFYFHDFRKFRSNYQVESSAQVSG